MIYFYLFLFSAIIIFLFLIWLFFYPREKIDPNYKETSDGFMIYDEKAIKKIFDLLKERNQKFSFKKEKDKVFLDLSELRKIKFSEETVEVGYDYPIEKLILECKKRNKELLFLPFFISDKNIEETLFYGIGYYSKTYGHFSQSLISFRILLPSGEIKKVFQNEDLFNAVISSPPETFGIILNYQFQISTIKEKYYFKFTYNKNLDEVIKNLFNLKKFSSRFNYSIILRKEQIIIEGVFFGKEFMLHHRLKKLIKPDFEEILLEVPRKEEEIHNFQKLKSIYGKDKILEKQLDDIKNVLFNFEGNFEIILRFLKNHYLLIFKYLWDEQKEVISWNIDKIEGLFQRLKPYLSSYSCKAIYDPEIYNLKKYYGKNLKELIKLKEEIDPDFIFNNL